MFDHTIEQHRNVCLLSVSTSSMTSSPRSARYLDNIRQIVLLSIQPIVKLIADDTIGSRANIDIYSSKQYNSDIKTRVNSREWIFILKRSGRRYACLFKSSLQNKSSMTSPLPCRSQYGSSNRSDSVSDLVHQILHATAAGENDREIFPSWQSNDLDEKLTRMLN